MGVDSVLYSSLQLLSQIGTVFAQNPTHILQTVTWKSPFFWHVALCHWVIDARRFEASTLPLSVGHQPLKQRCSPE